MEELASNNTGGVNNPAGARMHNYRLDDVAHCSDSILWSSHKMGAWRCRAPSAIKRHSRGYAMQHMPFKNPIAIPRREEYAGVPPARRPHTPLQDID